MDISIVICSYNRAPNLPVCFEHLLKQVSCEDITWEIILVDNNSSDDTRAIAEQYATDTPLNISYSFEGQQGLSHARNNGIALAKGQWVAFIDDDIRVSTIWLKTLYDVFVEQDCDAVGGRIHIESPQSLPRWISPDMYGFLGHQDFGPEPHKMDGIDESPFGGNMAVHRRVFDKIGVFDTTMGRSGEGNTKEELFKGEETDFFERLADSGGSFFYHPDLLVLHKILPYQLKMRFFLTLHNNSGIMKASSDCTVYKRTLLGVPLYVLPQLLRSIGKYIGSSISKGPNNSFRLLMNVAYFSGMITSYHAKNKHKEH